MKTKFVLLTLIGAFVSLASVPGRAALVTTAQSVHSALSFTDSNHFADAGFSSNLVYSYSGSAGDTASFGLNFSHPSTNVSLTSSNSSSLALSNTLIGLNAASTDLTSVDGAIQQLTVHIERVPNGPTIMIDNSGPLTILKISNSSLWVQPLNTFTYEIVMPGDWSTLGTSIGQHELVNVNALWTVDADFLYDGTNTRFAAHLNNYQNGQGQEIGLRFNLFGANVVPIPSTLGLVLPLLGFLAWSARRRPQGLRLRRI